MNRLVPIPVGRAVRASGVAALLVAVFAALGLSGCGTMGFRGGTGKLAMTSTDSDYELVPETKTAVYATSDIAAADIYLSDLPQDRLIDPEDDLSGLSGSIVHIRLFLVPRAGNTPISTTACNITVRHVIVASGAEGAAPSIGVYGGGGFLFPSGSPGDKSFGGRLSGATLRLLESTEGFEDLFGTAVVSGRLTSKLDAEAAHAIAARVQELADESAER